MMRRYLTSWQVRRDARRDRKHNVPPASAKALCPAERRIQSTVNASIRELQIAYSRAAEPLKARLNEAVRQLRDVELPEWTRAVERTRRFQEDVMLRPFSHWLMMIILTIGEAAFNVVAFSGAAREARGLSMTLALAVSVAIPAFAYVTGIAARQYEPRRRKLLWVMGWSTVALAVMFVTNEVRTSYINASDAGGAKSALLYFGLNAGVFAAAVAITYIAMDSDAGFVKAKRRVEKRKRQIAVLRGRLNELGERLRHRSNLAREAGQQLIAIYRMENRLGRREVPGYYDDDSDPNHIVTFVQVDVARFDEDATADANVEPTRPRVVQPIRVSAEENGEPLERVQ